MNFDPTMEVMKQMNLQQKAWGDEVLLLFYFNLEAHKHNDSI